MKRSLTLLTCTPSSQPSQRAVHRDSIRIRSPVSRPRITPPQTERDSSQTQTYHSTIINTESTMTSADTKAISKRQRRAQGSNPSTTWQQQPRIKSAASRARGYINYAGLNDNDDHPTDDGKSKKKKKKGSTTRKVQEMLDPELDLNSPEVKFGRMLGGTEQRARHKAVKMLRHYLTQRVDIANGAGLSELDLMKLWKVSVCCFV